MSDQPAAGEAWQAAPIFVFGITGRTGTNYLRDLIVRHRDCRPARAPIWEDFLLDQSPPLLEFVRRLRGKWAAWEAGFGDDLLPALGRALVSYLSTDPDRHVVTKTPSTRNLDHFFDLFPGARPVVIVRDPRSVVASAVRSFDADYEGWARDWARGAARVVDFQRHCREAGHVHHVVRYEDLITDTRATLTDLFAAIGLDPDGYDFDEAERIPVRGSSEIADEGDMHWRPVERAEGFDPLHRWESWSVRKLQRVEWLAGPHMETFGYERRAPAAGAMRHRARDAVLLARLAVRQGRRRLDPRRAAR